MRTDGKSVHRVLPVACDSSILGVEPELMAAEHCEISGAFCFLFPNSGINVPGGSPLFCENSFMVASDLPETFI